MSKISVIILFLILMISTGCASYKDINETLFTTVTVIDVDEEGNPVVYMECFLAYYSQVENSEKGARTAYVGKGETITEAIQNINQTSRHELNTVYSKMLIFTKKAAEQGIGDYLDVLVRDQEFLLRPYIAILEGDVPTLFDEKNQVGDYIGVYLEDLFQNEEVFDLMHPYKLYNYMNLMATKSHVVVIGLISIEPSVVDPFVGVKKAAVLKDNKMMDTLGVDEYKIYCLLDAKSEIMMLTIPHPDEEKAKITLKALKVDTKKSIEIEGAGEYLIHYKITVNLTLSVNETQKTLNLDQDQTREALEKEIKEKIMKEGQDLFNKYKLKDIDLFSVKEELYRKYPNYKIDDVLRNTELEIEVNAKIEGSPNVQNYEMENDGE